ncbi:MAG TPA: TlpA disulfide reductase family protein [Puia sp.]|nr:TlpA disulfide reductase family protein [Puia sp.]
MIRKMKMPAFALLFFFSSIAGAQQPYTISGTIGKLEAPSKVYMYYQDVKGAYVFDSATLMQGHFEFRGSIDQPRKGALLLTCRPVHFKFFMEVLTKVAKEEDFKNASLDVLSFYVEPGSTRLISSDSLYKATVSGGPLNMDLSMLNREKVPAYNTMKGSMNSLYAAVNAGKLTMEKQRELDSIYAAGIEDLKKCDLHFAANHPASFVSLEILKRYIETCSAGGVIEPIFLSLSADLRHSTGGRSLETQITEYRKIDIGSMAPGFTQPDTAGRFVKLSDFRGKYVLLDFWASWCSPCRAENPNMLYTYQVFKGKPFTVLGVSLDRSNGKAAWLKGIRDDGLTWTQVSDLKGGDNAAAAVYHVKNIPQNFLIDPQGKIVARNLHGGALQQKLAALLN